MAKQQNSNPLNIVYTDLGLDKAGVSFEDFESKFNTDANVRRTVYNDLGLKKAGVEYETFESKLKKKDSSTGARSTSTSFANGGVTDLNSLASTTSTATPIPLTAKGVTPYQQGRQKQQRDLNLALGAFEEAQGVGSVAKIQEAIRTQPVATIRDSSQDPSKAEKSIKNSFTNLATSLKGVVPRLDLVSTAALEKTIGREAAKSFTDFLNYNPLTGEQTGRDFATIQNEALDRLEELSNLTRPTEGVIDNIRNFNIGGLAAATVDAVTSLASTAIPSIASGGTLLATEMVGGSLYDYNNAKAKSKGITTKELYEKGEADFNTPAFLGSVAFALEKVGLKGVANGIKRNIAGNGYKKALLLANETNKEGLTEFIQVGIDTANQVLGEGGTIEEATELALDNMFSARGLEAYAKGALGSGVAIGGGRLIQKAITPKAKQELISLEETRTSALQDLASDTVPIESKEAIVEVLADTQEKINTIVNTDLDDTENLSEEQFTQVQDLSQKIADIDVAIPNVSETTKTVLGEQKANLETQLNNIINNSKTQNNDVRQESNNEERRQENVDVQNVNGQQINGENVNEETFQTEEVTPTKVKVLGKEVNSYLNYVPSNPEDIKSDDIYVFTATSKEGIPQLLQDKASVNTSEVNGVKSENLNATISGEDLKELFPKQEVTPTAGVVESATPVIESLKDVDSTAKALEGKGSEKFIPLFDVLGEVTSSEFNKQQAIDVINMEIEILPDDIKFAKDKDRQMQLKERLEYLSNTKNKEKEVESLFKELEKYSSERLANSNKKVSEAYHKAKEDGSNPELVKAVEELLTNKTQENATTQGNIQQDNQQQREGVVSQEQGQQENRQDQETVDQTTENQTGVSDSTNQSREIINEGTGQAEGTTVDTGTTRTVQEGETNQAGDIQDLQTEDIEVSVPRNLFEAIRGGEKAIAARAEQVLKEFREANKKATSGLNVDAATKALEYAVLKIADGTIKSAKALAKALEIDDADDLYNKANTLLTEYNNAKVEPKKVTIEQNIKRATEGGTGDEKIATQRELFRQNLQSLNRGILEGRRQQREKGTKKADLIKEAKQKVSDFIDSFKQTDYFKGKRVPEAVMADLARRAMNANTVTQIYQFSEYFEKVIENVDIFDRVQNINKLKTKVKGLAKKLSKRKASKELAQTLKDITKINPTLLSVEDIKAYESLLDNASRIFDSPDANVYTEAITNLEDKTEKAKQIREIKAQTRRLTEEWQKAKIESLSKQLKEEGVTEEVIKSLSENANLQGVIDSLQKELDAKTDEDTGTVSVTNKQREKLSFVYEYLKEEVQGDLDTYREVLTPKEMELLEQALTLNAEQLSDAELFNFVASLRNLTINESLDGIGKIAAKGNFQNNLNNKTLLDNFKDGVRRASSFGKLIREGIRTKEGRKYGIGTGESIMSSYLKNTKYAGKVLGLLGLPQFQENAAKVKRKIQTSYEDIGKLFEKYKGLNDAYKIHELGVLADLVQYKESWDADQIAENLQIQKDQLAQTIKEMEDITVPEDVRKATKEKVQMLKDIYNSVKDLTLPQIQEKLNNADEGIKALYEMVRSKYDEVAPEASFVAKQYGKNTFESGWNNYVSRAFTTIDGKPQGNIETIAEGAQPMFSTSLNANKSTKASALEGRVGGMRKGYIRDYNFVVNFFKTYNDLMYDIATIEDRNYMANALDSRELIEKSGVDAGMIRAMESLVVQKLNGDSFATRLGTDDNTAKKFLNGYVDLAVAQALGGIGQVAKQGVPVITDTFVRTINNPELLPKAMINYIQNRKEIDKFMEVTEVSRRTTAGAVMPTFSESAIKSLVGKTLGSKGYNIEKLIAGLKNASMGILTWSDQESANISWLTFYMEYLKQEKGITDIDFTKKADSDAVAYANLKFAAVGNTSDSSLKPQLQKSGTFRALYMFSSFAFNSAIDLASNVARLRNISGNTKAEYEDIVKNIGGNLSAVVAFHYTANIIRNAAIAGLGYASIAIINAISDDEEEKEEYARIIGAYVDKRQESNQTRSKLYWLNDFAFRGIGSGLVGDATEDFNRELGRRLGVISEEEAFKLEQAGNYKAGQSGIEKIITLTGVFGIPAQNAVSLWDIGKDVYTEDFDEENFLLGRFGKERASGTGMYVPKEDKNKTLTAELKTIGTTTAVLSAINYIFPIQEVGTFTRGLTSLNKEIRDIKYGKRVKDREEKLKTLKSLSEFKYDGREILLTPEQLDYALQVREKEYNKIYNKYKKLDTKSGIEEAISEKSISDLLNSITKLEVVKKYGSKSLKDKDEVTYEELKSELDFKVSQYIKSKQKDAKK